MAKGIDVLAREKSERALEVLESVMENDLAEDRDRLRAAEAILDRGYGKPSQAIIQVPASKQQAALLAAMSDDDLVRIIEQKQLPSLTPKQPLITIPTSPRATSSTSSHGPKDFYGDETADEIDPLLA